MGILFVNVSVLLSIICGLGLCFTIDQVSLRVASSSSKDKHFSLVFAIVNYSKKSNVTLPPKNVGVKNLFW